MASTISMSSIRRQVALGNHPVARLARKAYFGLLTFHLPAPRLLIVPVYAAFVLARSVYYFLFRVLISEPFFRAACRRVGKNLTTGSFVHWIAGKGDILVGDNCVVDGKISVYFGTRFADRPTLEIGDRTGIGHLCSFVVAKHIKIGNYCHIAGGTRLFDSSGHPVDPERRLRHLPPDADDVKPIVIGDNVWIGAYSTIFPGVTIGDNSVVATGSVVTTDVPPNTLVAGYPARMIRRLDPPAADASPAGRLIGHEPAVSPPPPRASYPPTPSNTAAE